MAQRGPLDFSCFPQTFAVRRSRLASWLGAVLHSAVMSQLAWPDVVTVSEGLVTESPSHLQLPGSDWREHEAEDREGDAQRDSAPLASSSSPLPDCWCHTLITVERCSVLSLKYVFSPLTSLMMSSSAWTFFRKGGLVWECSALNPDPVPTLLSGAALKAGSQQDELSPWRHPLLLRPT